MVDPSKPLPRPPGVSKTLPKPPPSTRKTRPTAFTADQEEEGSSKDSVDYINKVLTSTKDDKGLMDTSDQSVAQTLQTQKGRDLDKLISQRQQVKSQEQSKFLTQSRPITQTTISGSKSGLPLPPPSARGTKSSFLTAKPTSNSTNQSSVSKEEDEKQISNLISDANKQSSIKNNRTAQNLVENSVDQIALDAALAQSVEGMARESRGVDHRKTGLPLPPPSARGVPKTAEESKSAFLTSSKVQPPPSSRTSGLPLPPPSARGTRQSGLPLPPPSARGQKPTDATASMEQMKTSQDGRQSTTLSEEQLDDLDDEAKKRRQRQEQLKNAQLMQEKLKAEIAKNQQSKLASMTSEEQMATLLEHKRLEQQKQLQQEQEQKLKEEDLQLATEISKIRKEKAQVENEATQAKLKKEKIAELTSQVKEIEDKIQLNSEKNQSVFDQALSEKKALESEITESQTEIQTQDVKLDHIQLTDNYKKFREFELKKQRLTNQNVELDLQLEKYQNNFDMLSSHLTEQKQERINEIDQCKQLLKEATELSKAQKNAFKRLKEMQKDIIIDEKHKKKEALNRNKQKDEHKNQLTKYREELSKVLVHAEEEIKLHQNQTASILQIKKFVKHQEETRLLETDLHQDKLQENAFLVQNHSQTDEEHRQSLGHFDTHSQSKDNLDLKHRETDQKMNDLTQVLQKDDDSPALLQQKENELQEVKCEYKALALEFNQMEIIEADQSFPQQKNKLEEQIAQQQELFKTKMSEVEIERSKVEEEDSKIVSRREEVFSQTQLNNQLRDIQTQLRQEEQDLNGFKQQMIEARASKEGIKGQQKLKVQEYSALLDSLISQTQHEHTLHQKHTSFIFQLKDVALFSKRTNRQKKEYEQEKGDDFLYKVRAEHRQVESEHKTHVEAGETHEANQQKWEKEHLDADLLVEAATKTLQELEQNHNEHSDSHQQLVNELERHQLELSEMQMNHQNVEVEEDDHTFEEQQTILMNQKSEQKLFFEQKQEELGVLDKQLLDLELELNQKRQQVSDQLMLNDNQLAETERLFEENAIIIDQQTLITQDLADRTEMNNLLQERANVLQEYISEVDLQILNMSSESGFHQKYSQVVTALNQAHSLHKQILDHWNESHQQGKENHSQAHDEHESLLAEHETHSNLFDKKQADHESTLEKLAIFDEQITQHEQNMSLIDNEHQQHQKQVELNEIAKLEEHKEHEEILGQLELIQSEHQTKTEENQAAQAELDNVQTSVDESNQKKEQTLKELEAKLLSLEAIEAEILHKMEETKQLKLESERLVAKTQADLVEKEQIQKDIKEVSQKCVQSMKYETTNSQIPQKLEDYSEDLDHVLKEQTQQLESARDALLEYLSTFEAPIEPSQQEEEAEQVEEEIQAAAVPSKRRHARNQSMIGQLAASTFEVDDSRLNRSELEQQVMNALQADSEGSKVTIIEQRDTTLQVQEELKNIEEADEESQNSSEIHFGAVQPLATESQHRHQWSKGSVELPRNTPETESIPTQVAEVSAVVPQLKKEIRPTIFDMRKSSISRGSSRATFKATAYDKTPRQEDYQGVNHTDDTVLGDLLVCLLSNKKLVTLHSDFELCQGYQLFSTLFSQDKKCHEAMFGLARINYCCGRYELAEKLLIKAYECKRDFVYRVWLGFTQLQMYMVSIDQKPKLLKNALANLDRCSQEKRVGMYANFALIYLYQQAVKDGMELKGFKGVQTYQKLIETKDGQYEGQLAQALIHQGSGKLDSAIQILKQLCQKDKRPHAYFVLARTYLLSKQVQQAREVMEQALSEATQTTSFQERLTIVLILGKCLALDGQSERAICLLQMQYTEQPHYNTLLYEYAKVIIQSPTLHQKYLPAAISALEEVKRVSLQARAAQACYYLSLAYKLANNTLMEGINQVQYLNGVKQCVKMGEVKQKKVDLIKDTQTIWKLILQLRKWHKPQPRAQESLLLHPAQAVSDQIQEKLSGGEIQDQIKAVDSLNLPKRDKNLYKAIVMYKLCGQVKEAEALLIMLQTENPIDVEVQTEVVKFTRYCLKTKNSTQFDGQKEARSLLVLVRNQNPSGDQWANALNQSAKLLFTLAQNPDQIIEALEALLQMKMCLPQIDQDLAAVQLPLGIQKYANEEIDNIDFQIDLAQASELAQQHSADNLDFNPVDEIDSSNKFFLMTKHVSDRIQKSPLASLSVSEIRDQTRAVGEQLFHFGTIQTQLAYEVEDQKTIQIKDRYYRSSTPLIAVVRYLKHLKRLEGVADVSSKVDHSLINDTGFCVRSCPDFLYTIAKMCFQAGLFIDLAVQSLIEYHMMISYYKNFIPEWKIKDSKAKILFMLILKKLSPQSLADPQIREMLGNVRKYVGSEVAEPSTQKEYLLVQARKLIQLL